MLNPFRKKDEDKKTDEIKLAPLPEPPALPAASSYSEAFAHLLDELHWLNRLLAAHVLRLRRVDFYDRVKNFRDLFIADEEIDALITAGVFEKEAGRDDDREKLMAKLLGQAQSLRLAISRRVQDALSQHIGLPLIQLAGGFHLSEFEQQVLVICLAPQIDARYEKLYAYLQNDIAKKFPSIELILGLLAASPDERLQMLPYLAPNSTLRHFGLLESPENEAGTSAAQHFLRADTRIVQYVLGNQTVDARVMPHLRFFPALAWEKFVAPERLQSRWRKLFARATGPEGNQYPIFYLCGHSGVGKKTLARALCSEAGVALAVADMRALGRGAENFSDKIRLILRESLLQPCAVYFDHLESLENSESEQATRFPALIQEIHDLGWLTFLGSENPLPAELLDLAAIYSVEIPAPDYAGQKTLWELHLNGALGESERRQIDDLTARFDLTGGQISRAVRRAKLAAFVRDPENPQVTLDDLFASSRTQSQPKLSTLARKIAPKYGWKDLVLPEEQVNQLHEMVTQVQRRQLVMAEWGFANKLSLGHGLNALFAGPSGTGKTMAAEVIANDLGLDLYKIDLSAVVSKYIGETEKNLNRIFTEAEHSNAILFFDEADALFGKRSEVRDSHDRYANIEIAYLLQKMEEYKGMTILATNLRQNLDDAFTRRIRFIIEFPFPNEQYRRRIWQGIWPAATPVAPEVDWDFLAQQFKLSGGHIRNVALAAAFLAAENGQMVTMKHLLQATKREFQKMGKVVSESEFGQAR